MPAPFVQRAVATGSAPSLGRIGHNSKASTDIASPEAGASPAKDSSMPLYDYHCTTCNVQFELLVRSTDVPACPTCGATGIERLISAIAPAGRAKAVAGSMRAQAAREGHLSNFGRSGR